MSRIVLAVTVFCLFVVSPSSCVLAAQEKGLASPAPVPSPILTGKKVFISNGGLDGPAFVAFRKLGDVNQPYNAFYTAMASWGKYALVASPIDADLVFEIRFIAPFVGGNNIPEPQMNLIIYDAKTRFVLWTILAPVDGAFRKATFIRNVNQGIATLMVDLKSLHGEPANSTASDAK